MATGTVKWFNPDKGYGFVSNDNGGDDLFVHHSSILRDGFRTLYEGEPVEFEPAEGRKGPEAVNVRPLQDPPANPPRQGSDRRDSGSRRPPSGRR